jgi:hypothetical protein
MIGDIPAKIFRVQLATAILPPWRQTRAGSDATHSGLDGTSLQLAIYSHSECIGDESPRPLCAPLLSVAAPQTCRSLFPDTIPFLIAGARHSVIAFAAVDHAEEYLRLGQQLPRPFGKGNDAVHRRRAERLFAATGPVDLHPVDFRSCPQAKMEAQVVAGEIA